MYRMILLAYDGSREGRLALREGAEVAAACRAKTCLLAVLDLAPEIALGEGFDAGHAVDRDIARYREVLDQGVERLRNRGLAVEGRMVQGQPSERIADVAREIGADLVVVGHRNRSRLARWWQGASVSASLLEQAPCSVLVAIAPGEPQTDGNAGENPA
ncbi:MAG TPA: universal stress protein [Gammaproteobacteria bacterium]|nr:universal stress protein [Gammaproteobacteria bacterium]